MKSLKLTSIFFCLIKGWYKEKMRFVGFVDVCWKVTSWDIFISSSLSCVCAQIHNPFSANLLFYIFEISIPVISKANINEKNLSLSFPAYHRQRDVDDVWFIYWNLKIYRQISNEKPWIHIQLRAKNSQHTYRISEEKYLLNVLLKNRLRGFEKYLLYKLVKNREKNLCQ